MVELIFTQDGFYIDQLEELISKQDKQTQDFLIAFEKNNYKALYNSSFKECPAFFGVGLKYLHLVSETFINNLLKEPSVEYAMGHMEYSLNDEILEQLLIKAPYGIGSEYINASYIQTFTKRILDIYNEETGSFDGSLKKYLSEKNNNLALCDKVYFHLVESDEEMYPFAFLATYSAPKVEGKKTYHMPLQHAFEIYKDDTEKLVELLSTVIKVSKKSKFIKDLVESGEIFHAIRFTTQEATTFLQEVSLYEEYGIVCRIPNWWRKKTSTPSTSFVIEGEEDKLNLDALVKFMPVVKVGDVILTKEDLYELLNLDEGLIRFKGQWVNIKKEHIEDLLEILEENRDGIPYSIGDLIKSQFVAQSEDDEIEGVMRQEFMNVFTRRLRSMEVNTQAQPLHHLQATLRPYQKDGYEWLYAMHNLQFGHLLADDMGLGKTVQVLALLDGIQLQENKKPCLLVVPASLISNWESEIHKFLPNLTYKVLHNSQKGFDRDHFLEEDVVLYITTYAMVKKIEQLSDVMWHMVILDEAQAIKTPTTKQTKAVKALKSEVRLALTGTPVENNPGDVWSLFDFLNPGLLGNQTQFKRYVSKLNKEPEEIVRLRKTITPFILRRLKTDKSIISDLPEKIEIKDYVELTPKQAALYTKVVDELVMKLESEDGISRKGLVLGSLTALKQICNHPSQYLGDGKYKPSDSGKFAYISEVFKTIKEKRERVLVFTQYAEIIPFLDEYLEKLFGRKGFVISGKTPVKKRGEIVNQFNDPNSYTPYVILSLKAGGTGLNLTAANHVVHFDRWWNPAVENQATDRAYRIGQKNDVIVRKLITKGTLEETIDQKIESKIKLAEDILSDEGLGKTIMGMSNEEIIDLVSLKGGETL